MKKTKEAIEEKGSITKWMYIKESKWLPVIYTPFQDINAFCSIYCRGKDWIPLILDQMMHDLEEQFLSECEDWWAKLSERERLEITIKAWRQAQQIWNFFRDTAKKVNAWWRYPFIIRMRHWQSKNKDLLQ